MSGSTHNKGVLILSGYLREKYARDKPLSMSASIAFEQSYGGIDGDSASSTEIYALLSSLSGVPLRQDVATTRRSGRLMLFSGDQKVEHLNHDLYGSIPAARRWLMRKIPTWLLVPPVQPHVLAAILLK
jgi:hypothetical protein